MKISHVFTSLFCGWLALPAVAFASTNGSLPGFDQGGKGSNFIQRCRVLRDFHHTMLRVELTPEAQSTTAQIDVRFIDRLGNLKEEWIDVRIEATGDGNEAIAVAEPDEDYLETWAPRTPNQDDILDADGAEVYFGGTLQAICPVVTTIQSEDTSAFFQATGICPDCMVAQQACRCSGTNLPGSHWMCEELPASDDFCPDW